MHPKMPGETSVGWPTVAHGRSLQYPPGGQLLQEPNGLRAPEAQGAAAQMHGLTPYFLLGIFVVSSAVCPAQSYGLDCREPIGPLLDHALPGVPPGLVSSGGWTTVPAFPNLTFPNPVVLLAEPRANRLFVCGREGVIYFFASDPATATKTLFLDIQLRTQG